MAGSTGVIDLDPHLAARLTATTSTRTEMRGVATPPPSKVGNGFPNREYRRDRSLPRGLGAARVSRLMERMAVDGRDRSPLRGKDDNSETMHIESSLVGLIIGRQGENLRRIENETHCRVQFIPATTPADEFRLCRITGPAPRRAEARAAINRIIEDSGMGAIARAGLEKSGPRNAYGTGSVPPLKEGEETLKIMVPDRTVGLIIGRGGETIRDLQERSGCHINIVGENKSVNGLRPVNLIGSHEAAKHAKDLIMEIVDSDSRNAGQQPQARSATTTWAAAAAAAVAVVAVVVVVRTRSTTRSTYPPRPLE